VHHIDWGQTKYAEALDAQRQLVAQRKAGEIPDTLVLTEHWPVYTIGARSGAAEHLLWDPDRLKSSGIEAVPTNRGGDITYHGPGQLVAYPIIDWSRRRDLHAYLRFLEDVLIATLAQWQLQAGRREGKTGIWLEDRKIAAIGVAVKSWITYHGLALNIDPDLAHFEGIVPCGITDGTVTSMSRELGEAPPMESVKSALILEFSRQFSKLQS